MVWTVGAEVQPDAGEYTGQEGVRRFWDLWHDTSSRSCAPTDGGAGSGAEVLSPPFVQVFRIREGLITHVWLHIRRERALEAAGLDEA